MVPFNDSLKLGNAGKINCMPVLPKLAKRGVFGKNAILKRSLTLGNSRLGKNMGPMGLMGCATGRENKAWKSCEE